MLTVEDLSNAMFESNENMDECSLQQDYPLPGVTPETEEQKKTKQTNLEWVE